MLHIYALHLANQLVMRIPIADNKIPVYVYGIELSLSTLISTLSILLFSALFHDILSGILFIVTFVGLRLFSGGYHASTYMQCFLLSNTIFVVAYFLASILVNYNATFIILVLLVSASTVITLLAPIKNIKHPISSHAYVHNKHISQVLCFIFSSIVLCFIVAKLYIKFTAILSISMTAVAVLMLVEKAVERRS